MVISHVQAGSMVLAPPQCYPSCRWVALAPLEYQIFDAEHEATECQRHGPLLDLEGRHSREPFLEPDHDLAAREVRAHAAVRSIRERSVRILVAIEVHSVRIC